MKLILRVDFFFNSHVLLVASHSFEVLRVSCCSKIKLDSSQNTVVVASKLTINFTAHSSFLVFCRVFEGIPGPLSSEDASVNSL